jgi:hypothetical protein
MLHTLDIIVTHFYILWITDILYVSSLETTYKEYEFRQAIKASLFRGGKGKENEDSEVRNVNVPSKVS